MAGGAFCLPSFILSSSFRLFPEVGGIEKIDNRSCKFPPKNVFLTSLRTKHGPNMGREGARLDGQGTVRYQGARALKTGRAE